jgi:hypothetical protein
MFFENYYITYSNNLVINSISSYRNIMNNFILKFISEKKLDYLSKEELYLDAIIYSKYYLYWKTFSCVYQDNIMGILYDIEYIK